MKKTSLLLGCAAATAVLLGACNKNDGNTSSTTVSVPVFNLFTPVGGAGTPFVGSATYGFTVEYPAATVTLTTNKFNLPNGSSGSFTTIPMSFDYKIITVDNMGRESLSFKVQDPSDKGAKISNLNANLTQAVNFPPNMTDIENAQGGYKWLVPTSTMHFAFVQFNYNDEWNVRSFWPDLTYKGTTSTTYPSDMRNPFGSEKVNFTGTDPQFRIIMQVKDGAITNKADVMIYGPKFAPTMPELGTMLLENLDLEFTNSGYTVSGKDVIPSLLEGGEWQPYPGFPFNDFNAVVDGNLTTSRIQFTVAGMFAGSFSGSCIATK